jgi:Tfp pilus assembly protein PilX
MKGIAVASNERGFALVVSMLILLVMTLLGLVLMSSVVLNRSLAGNDQRMRQSLDIAEAGVGEALGRIAHQETQMDASQPADVCQVFNTAIGSVPALGADSVGLATGQAVGSYLNYTTATRSPDALTIGWKKDPTGTIVMRYDPSNTPHVNALSGSPIYQITATGRVGTTRRSVVTEVIQRPYNVSVLGALVANVPVDVLGNSVICGYNHSINTPENDGKKGRINPAPIPPNDPDYCGDNELGFGDKPGIWGSQTVNPGGTFFGYGNPAWLTNQSGFPTGPWDALGLSQSDFWSFVGAPVSVPSNWKGISYVDNNSVTQDHSASLNVQGISGEGFLYVDGDLKISSSFSYVGLVYVEGDLTISGNAWILGGMIVNGNSHIKANGGMTILYSADAITQSISKYGGQFVTLSWREQ